ncbi:hypothetical protein DO97_08375 [Neosynechococcus sphagnicola sy1]|uniref:O-GlcNAc transferase C-terminal domain-containing protein n=2 Tax=Neosynechococcus TaxID=1501143 RepID=A0A098TJJ4_9CYAN|nr:hypothetical protein DO97_08375 [Neosynechococcus sphagnicola sy1]
MYQHSVSYFLEPLLAHHDPARVETFCYADVATPDAVTERLQKLSHHWRSTRPLSDEELYEQILGDRIDVLVDLTGHTGKNRLQMFARKPAPLQITYLGYPNTTGLAAMDYRLTDIDADPPGLTEAYHTETLLRLPRCFLCYQPLSTAPAVLDLPGKTMGRITFGSFNNLPKLTLSVIAVWSQILHAVPDARLILKVRWLEDEPTRQHYLDLFAAQKIPPQRVKLIGMIPDADHHLNFYNNIDIALDPFPYNGTATTCEALWMGVPVITLAGSTHVSRVGLSLLNAVGLPELITHSHQEYIATAVTLAANREHLANLRSRLRPQMAASALCHGMAHAQAVEATFHTEFSKWNL